MQFNLILGLMWLCIGVPLLLINLTPVQFLNLPANERTLMIGVLALILSLYNFARWLASRAMARNRAKKNPPPKKKALEGRSLEYNPEFDFTRPGAKTLPVDDEGTKG